jgi:hypothetical protein
VGKYGTNLEGFGGFEGGVNADKGAPLVSTSSDGETALLFGPAALREINAGVANGDFSIPPDAAGDTITAENPLPYWTFTDVNSAGAITCAVVADSSAGSGNVLRWTIANNTITGKSAQISRYIPVASSRDRQLSIDLNVNIPDALGTNAQFKLTYSYVKQDLTATGTGASATSTSNGNLNPAVSVANVIPSDAAYVYLIITAETTGTTAALTGDIAEIRFNTFSSRILITERSDATTYVSGKIESDNGDINITPNNAAGKVAIAGNFDVSGNVEVTGNITADSNVFADAVFFQSGFSTSPYIATVDSTNGRMVAVGNTQGTHGADLAARGATSTTRSGVIITKGVAGQPSTNLNGTGTTDAFSDALRNGGIAVDTTNNRGYFYSSGWKFAALTTPSDSRLKEEITAITGALDTLRQLMPVAFKWKAPDAHGRTDAVADDGKRLGFIADQVATTDLAHWVETLGVDEREAHLVDTTEVLAVNIPQNEMEALLVQALLDIDTRLKALEEA